MQKQAEKTRGAKIHDKAKGIAEGEKRQHKAEKGAPRPNTSHRTKEERQIKCDKGQENPKVVSK